MPDFGPCRTGSLAIVVSIALAAVTAPVPLHAGARLFERPDSVVSAPRVPGAEGLRFQRGDSLAFALSDGRLVRGIFAGAASLPTPNYERRYRAWRSASADSGALPEWDERLRFPDGGLQCVRAGRFAGVDPLGVAVRANAHARIERARFEQFHFMFGARGRRYEGGSLHANVMRADVPWRSAMRLRTSAGEETVAIDDVSAIESRAGGMRPVRREEFPAVLPPGPTHTQLVVQGGVFDFGVRGIEPFAVVGVRVSPAVPGRPGADVAFQYAHNSLGSFFITDLAAAGLLPLGPKLALEPRLGTGLYNGGGGWFGTWNLGIGLLAFAGRHVVVRVDYARHLPMGVLLNRDFSGTNMLQFGVGASGR